MSHLYGIGIDIEEISRISRMVYQWGDAFTSRIFTQAEYEYCASKQNPAQHFAARFAAKEAFGKAIGTGWAKNFRWKDVEVTKAPSGQPTIVMHNAMKEFAENRTVLLSISHTATYVTALVVIQEK